MTAHTRRLISPTILATLALTLAACGYFQRDDADVSYDVELPMNFPEFDAGKLCPGSAEDCAESAQPALMKRELDPIDVDVEIDIVKASGEEELADFAGDFKSITVSKITYSVTPNTLTFDLPAIDLMLAPIGTESTESANAVKFATIPATPAGMTVTEADATIFAEHDDAISDLLKGLRVTALASAQPTVEEGQLFPPSGKAKIKATLFVTFTANPLDAAGL